MGEKSGKDVQSPARAMDYDETLVSRRCLSFLFGLMTKEAIVTAVDYCLIDVWTI